MRDNFWLWVGAVSVVVLALVWRDYQADDVEAKPAPARKAEPKAAGKRGRPKGSKNRRKAVPAIDDPALPAEVVLDPELTPEPKGVDDESDDSNAS